MLKVADLLSDPAHFCKGNLAEDKYGNKCDPTSDNAVKWCLRGALAYCYEDYFDRANALDRVTQEIKALPKPFLTIHGFNDWGSTTHADVVDLAKRAGV